MLSANFVALGADLQTLEDAGVHYTHWDIMDGVFVPNISFGLPVIRSARACCNSFFDVHLMLTDPLQYVDAFADAGADSITLHWETLNVEFNATRIQSFLAFSKTQKAIALNAYTPLEPLLPYVAQLDMVLLMSVEAGFGGQKFLPETLPKAEALANFLRNEGLKNIAIQMDGGIDHTNVQSVLDAGVTVIVAGSAVFGTGTITTAVQAFQHTFSKLSKLSKIEGSNTT